MKHNRKKIETFTEVYSDYYPIVFGSIYSKIRDKEVTLDLSQEVFTRFFEKFDNIENHRRWLHVTLKYVVYEYYKKANKYKDQKNIDDVFDDISLTYINAFRDVRLIINDALDDMDNFKNEKIRTLFELIAIQKLKHREAAMQLGLTVAQVKYYYAETVKSIRQYFKKRGINSLEELL